MRRAARCLFVALACALPGAALAQGAAGQNAIGSGPPAPQARPRVPDFAPPAVPGAGGSTLSTSLPVAKVNTGDPTVQLFAAVNSGDYNSAQDAVSRGADMNAQNSLGETPLDLSISLNRNTITFMLLSARNESGDGGNPVSAPMTATPASVRATGAAPHKARKFHVLPAQPTAPARIKSIPTASAALGTPDPSAGFLGFGK